MEEEGRWVTEVRTGDEENFLEGFVHIRPIQHMGRTGQQDRCCLRDGLVCSSRWGENMPILPQFTSLDPGAVPGSG